MGIDALQISNPVMGFRLDPGEPGMLRSGKANQATLLVTGQEHRNLVRLKSEAIRDGRVIIHAGIRFGRKFAGPYLTTASGLTTVISRPARPNLFETESQRAAAADQDSRPALEAELPPEQQFEQIEDPSSGRVLADHENRLRAELRRLESPGMGEPETEPDFVANEAGRSENGPLRPLEDAAERRESAGREIEARQVESDLRRVQFHRLMAGLSGSSSFAVSA